MGLMFSKDYGADILNCAETLESCGDTQGAAALHLFKEWTTHHNSFLVFESELTGHDPDNQRSPLYEQKDSSQLQLKGPVLTPQDVQVVVENGFLIMKRDTKAVGTYCVSHPKVRDVIIIFFSYCPFGAYLSDGRTLKCSGSHVDRNC